LPKRSERKLRNFGPGQRETTFSKEPSGRIPHPISMSGLIRRACSRRSKACHGGHAGSVQRDRRGTMAPPEAGNADQKTLDGIKAPIRCSGGGDGGTSFRQMSKRCCLSQVAAVLFSPRGDVCVQSRYSHSGVVAAGCGQRQYAFALQPVRSNAQRAQRQSFTFDFQYWLWRRCHGLRTRPLPRSNNATMPRTG
jgi:hypothetical protein